MVNSKAVSCQDYFSNWKIPKQKGRNGWFNVDAAPSINDHEETFSLDEEFQTFNLLFKIAIETYKKKKDIYVFV